MLKIRAGENVVDSYDAWRLGRVFEGEKTATDKRYSHRSQCQGILAHVLHPILNRFHFLLAYREEAVY